MFWRFAFASTAHNANRQMFLYFSFSQWLVFSSFVFSDRGIAMVTAKQLFLRVSLQKWHNCRCTNHTCIRSSVNKKPSNILQYKTVSYSVTSVTGVHMWQKRRHRWHLFSHLWHLFDHMCTPVTLVTEHVTILYCDILEGLKSVWYPIFTSDVTLCPPYIPVLSFYIHFFTSDVPVGILISAFWRPIFAS